MSGDETIRALREALAQSPENLPLRRHLAQTLASMGRFEEAVQEYRQALKLAPADASIKLSLAGAYFAQDNTSAAMVIVEDLLKGRPAPPAARLLYCRILLVRGEIDGAARAYREAIGADASLADPQLASLLGVGAVAETDASDPDSNAADGDRRVAMPSDGESLREFDASLERPAISFKDVGGMEDLKEQIRMKIIHPLKHPDLYRAYGKATGGGLLMYGPPGCGKTYLARATAGEVRASFLAIGIHDVLDMWLGNSEKNLHELFETARRHTPCVLFFDEVDALGASRSDLRTSAGKHLINQFLAELDGVKSTNEGILVLGATNAPWHLDPAFRRPGRFDRVLFVPPPDRAARRDILQILLAGKPAAGVDAAAVAEKTVDFSGADLKAVIDLAIEAKLREAMKASAPLPLTTGDLSAAAKQLRPTTKEWFATARNYALYSNEGGVYDDVLAWLRIK